MNKRMFSAFLAMILCLIIPLSGCSDGVSESDYQEAVKKNIALESAVSSLEKEKEQLESQLSEAKEQLAATPTPTPAPTPEPEPTPTPEPDMTEEEFKASCTAGYDYKELARDPKTYIGKPAQFKGEVVQVLEDSGIAEYRINVTQDEYGFWSDTIYVTYFQKDGEKRILEDDIVVVYGTMTDLVTYKTVMGNSISIPGLLASYIELAG